MRVALRRSFRGVQELLVAHVALTAAEENVGALLPLHTLATAEVEMKKHKELNNTLFSVYCKRSFY